MKAIRIPIVTLLAAPSLSAMEVQTPAEVKIAAAEKRIAQNPDGAQPYPPLAIALVARARETADPQFYAKAGEALHKALAIAPGDYLALRTEIAVLNGQHRFREALAKARALGKQMRDDSLLYTLRSAAAVGVGDYAEAEEAAQWAIDMDQGASTALVGAATMRELFGDFQGALDLIRRAFNRIGPNETGDRAWLLTRLGRLHLLENEGSAAEEAFKGALAAFPGYPHAVRGLADVRAAQGDSGAALELYRQHYTFVPHPRNLYTLAGALRRAGNGGEADRAFVDFELAAEAISKNADNANYELAFYFVDVAGRSADGLKIAEAEMARRQDVRTRHAYAWALHASGKPREAHEEMGLALAVGVRYPIMQYHAGIIARDAGEPAKAREHLEASLRQAPRSEVAPATLEALQALDSK